MKKILIALIVGLFVFGFSSLAFANQTSSFGWEDGTSTVLGYYEPSGCHVSFYNSTEQAYAGTHSLKMVEDPLNGTPQAFIWWVTGLTDGDEITASFWVYDINAQGDYPKGRIWGHYTLAGGTIDDYGGSAGGNNTYSTGPGWSQLSWTWTFDSNSGARDGFVVEARLYSGSEPGENVIFIDETAIEITSDTGTIYTLPVELSAFTAVYTNESGYGYVSINWTTASETDVIGFNIYRNIGETYGPSDKINNEPIAGHGTTTLMHTYSFKDEEADVYTSYYYWLEVVNLGGISDIHGPIKYKSIDIDGNGELNIITGNFNPCFPNPVQLGDEISFKFMVGGLEGNTKYVELKVYNVLGELVREIVNEEKMVDKYTETWVPRNLPPGVYLYQLKTENFNEVKKLVIIR